MINHSLFYSPGSSNSLTAPLSSSSSKLSTTAASCCSCSSSSSPLPLPSHPCHHDAKHEAVLVSSFTASEDEELSLFDKKCLIHQQTTTTMEEEKKKKKKQRRNVQFSTVVVLEFPQSIGCCTIPSSGGAPIGLKGFKPCRIIQYDDLDVYEEEQQHRRSTIQHPTVESLQLFLSVETRSQLLLDMGYTQKDIIASDIECFQIHQDRVETQVIVQLEQDAIRKQHEQVRKGGKKHQRYNEPQNRGKFSLQKALISTKRILAKSRILRQRQ